MEKIAVGLEKIIIGFLKSLILLIKVATPTCIGLTAALFGANYIGLIHISWWEVAYPLVIYITVTIVFVCACDIVQTLAGK